MGRIFRYRLLRNIFLITLLITVLLPAYSTFIAYPAFRDLLISITEDEAARVGAHVAGQVSGDPSQLESSLRPGSELSRELEYITATFRLMKIKLYDVNARVIYSTDREEVGSIMPDGLLLYQVMQGMVFTHIVEKGGSSMDGDDVTLDVAEIYVPIRHDGKAFGVAEIYYDISERKLQQEVLLLRSSFFLYGMAGLMLAIVMVMLNKLAAAIEQRQVAEAELSAHRDNLEDLVTARTGELERAVRELESFSYTVSHDLRSPLRAIDGFSHALLEDYGERLDHRGREHIHRVRAASQRMGALIDDLLMLSRISRREMRRQPVDLSAIAMELGALHKESSPDKRVELVIQRDLMTYGDPHLLRIALDNLLGNAFKYTSQESMAQIEVGSLKTGGERTFFIQDNGVGFDMDYAHKLFRPFERLHVSEGFEGTGIGLATVARIIERHGGRVWAEARLGQGATFFFALPETAD